MLEFIRRNKVFSICFAFCLTIILFLSTLLVFEKFNIDKNILALPAFNKPDEELIDPEFSLFKGNFNDENNTIFLTWDYQLNSHSFQKVELYHEDMLIGTYYDERQIEMPIFDYNICTGYNEFEVILYYDNGMAVTNTTTVFVDYIFDIHVDHQLVDNNLGKGYLLSITYTYNTNTPAGYPSLLIDTNYTKDFRKTWKWYQLPQIERNAFINDYQIIKVNYFIELEEFIDSEVEWTLHFKFDSVGVRHEVEFKENPATMQILTMDLE